MKQFGMDLSAELGQGKVSIGLYHTAGKGTRLAPLPGAENNNKPGVKIPAVISLDGKTVPATILESVIKQTGSYAASRKGRLSVFWGDQVFIPTASCKLPPQYHVDILCSLGPMMGEAEWREKGMDKYGLIAQAKHGGAAQVEKVDHATAVQLLSSLGDIESVGASLGSFSVSFAMLQALLNEYSTELSAKRGKLDSDPHLWMPMTLVESSYLRLMQQKGISTDVALAQYQRMAAMVQRFHTEQSASSLKLFGPVDVGQDVLWWDYGQLLLYQKNTLRLIDDSAETRLMKLFYGISAAAPIVGADAHSNISSSILHSASVNRSVVVNTRCQHIEANDAIIINVTARKIIAGRGSILYNIVDSSEEGITLNEGEVRVGVFSSDSTQMVIASSTSIDGGTVFVSYFNITFTTQWLGKSWDKPVLSNELSFAQVYEANADADPTVLEKVMSQMHDDAWGLITTSVRNKSQKRINSELQY